MKWEFSFEYYEYTRKTPEWIRGDGLLIFWAIISSFEQRIFLFRVWNILKIDCHPALVAGSSLYHFGYLIIQIISIYIFCIYEIIFPFSSIFFQLFFSFYSYFNIFKYLVVYKFCKVVFFTKTLRNFVFMFPNSFYEIRGL